MTIDAGVDAVSFGGTKNGLLGAEAVVFLSPESPSARKYVRKQVTQLPSKMRFLAAQFNAVLHDDLWIDLASHANAMATELLSADARRSTASTSMDRRRSTASSRASPPM